MTLTRRNWLTSTLVLAVPLLGGVARRAFAAAAIGQPAPEFVATDSYGQTVRLGALRGKVVVLEWTNDGCPYVGKWYRSGAMQQLPNRLPKQLSLCRMECQWCGLAASKVIAA